MDQQHIREILTGRRRGAAAGSLRAAAWVASKPYAVAMRVRRWAYETHLLPRRSVAVPVICVGNITTGGTGKTPMVAWVVRRLQEANLRPAVISRGYKARDAHSDEAELLKQLCAVQVFIDPDRYAAARRAVADGADVLVMDDGFQHLRLRRDLDIVLIDATNPFGFGYCLPRGLLREPLSALSRAGTIVVTRSDCVSPVRLGQLRDRLAELAPRASLHLAVHTPTCVIDERGGKLRPDALKGRRVGVFCGIANPEAFFTTVSAGGAKIVSKRIFDDHVAYTPKLLDELRRWADAEQVQLLVTTQKDGVKLRGARLGRALWQLAVQLDVVQGADRLAEAILAAARPIASTAQGG